MTKRDRDVGEPFSGTRFCSLSVSGLVPVFIFVCNLDRAGENMRKNKARPGFYFCF